jgi:uncharacterized protein YjbI with pentapeptide repeats
MKLSFRHVIAGWLLPALLVVMSLVAMSIYPQPAIADDYTKSVLAQADFSNRDLTGFVFDKATVRYGNFSNANLTGVSFFGANLDSVNLSGANLTNATLDTARLTRTNLTNAVLVGAFATFTKFDGAIIDGADFTDVMLRKDIQKQLCAIAKGTNPTTGRDTKDSLECA